MFSFYLSTIKKNATEERENVDFLCFWFQCWCYFCHKFQHCFLESCFLWKTWSKFGLFYRRMPWIGQISLTSTREKNDHFTLRIQGERTHVQKRYLLWPLRGELGMLNGTCSDSDGEMFPSKFGKLITLSLFYKFIKARKQYIYNKKISQNTCLCEICENNSLLGKGLNNTCK